MCLSFLQKGNNNARLLWRWNEWIFTKHWVSAGNRISAICALIKYISSVRKKMALLGRWCGSLYPEKETSRPPKAHSVLNSYFLGNAFRRKFFISPLLLSKWIEPLNVDWYVQNIQRKLMVYRALGVLGAGRDSLDLFTLSGSLLPPFLGVLGLVSHLAQSPISFFLL